MARGVRVVEAPSAKKTMSQRTGANYFDLIPDELLLKIFNELARIGPLTTPEDEDTALLMPFYAAEPHPGLRAYPFLAQVCRRWKHVLNAPASCKELWQDVVMDFGHELITAVHTPIEWSDRRPSDEEFRESFAATQLSAQRMLSFVEARHSSMRRLVLMNSEGYWSDDGDFVNLQKKHNFSMAHFGMMLGMVRTTLTHLQIQHCNDWFSMPHGALSAISCLPALRMLRIEDLHCRVGKEALAELAALTQLEELSLTGEEHVNAWTVGIECVPVQWEKLTKLKSLQLRGHNLLSGIPSWLTKLQLSTLDVSFCRSSDISVISELTSLEVLTLQGMDLSNPSGPNTAPDALRTRTLPNLDRLTALSALSLAENYLDHVPLCLEKLKRLQFLDLSLNPCMQVPAPLTMLLSLPLLRVVDFQGVHDDSSNGYWTNNKCVTMEHINALTKLLRRRPFKTKVLISLE